MEDSDGRVVSGVVKESEEAKQDFQAAVDEGKWAGVAYEITADGKQNKNQCSLIYHGC